jgi:hypothetical protein
MQYVTCATHYHVDHDNTESKWFCGSITLNNGQILDGF